MTTYHDKPWLQHYDAGVPHALTYPDIPLHDLLRQTARAHPAAPACLASTRLPLFGRRHNIVTYGELDALTDALAAALVDLGLQKGDRVALVMPNCAQFVLAFYAALKAGGVIAAVNPTYPANRMQHQLEDSGAKFVITLSLFYNTVTSVQAKTDVEHVIVTSIKEYLSPLAKLLFTLAVEKKEGHAIEKRPQDHWLQDLLARYAGKKPAVEVSADDRALFQYTGGTTGVAKAAVSTHRALVADTLQCRAWLSSDLTGQPHEESFLAAIPFFHVFGMVAVMSFAVSMGAAMVLVPNARDIDDVVDTLHTHRPALFMGVPSLYNSINHNAKVIAGEVSLRSLRACLSGSAPLPPATKQRFEELSGGKLLEGFGMSEMPTATHANPLQGENRTGSIGLPFPDVECRIVSLDDGETDVPVGEVGELLLHGPQMMIGYHNMPTETKNALRADAAGKLWFYTGDIARMDEDGYFYIVDRKKDMALIGGFNVYPRNVEDVLMSHPAVLEVGVAAIPHPDPEKAGQEALKAWVVLKPGESVTAEDLMAFASKDLARYETPSRYEFVTELPRSTVGKVLRRELVRMELEGHD
ncbi:MAG: long-chain fatty acid--CoA ligase [Anaerolineae bacterium]|nr:long-chain fatty acid--CoA ligase [Anaerolineae bacterium]